MLCSHCPINDSTGWLHIAVYLVDMLKPLDIFQRVTKSQKAHFPSPNGLQNFITSTVVNISPSSSERGDSVTGISPSLTNS